MHSTQKVVVSLNYAFCILNHLSFELAGFSWYKQLKCAGESKVRYFVKVMRPITGQHRLSISEKHQIT